MSSGLIASYTSPRTFAQRPFCAAAIRSRASGLRTRFLATLLAGDESPLVSATFVFALVGWDALTDKACLTRAICSSILERLSSKPSRAA